MLLYLKHIDIEGPETLGEFFAQKGFTAKTINLHRGDALPENIDDIEAVVCLGGPMNVDEEEKYNFLKQENEFIKRICGQRIPFLGICLGSQLLAKAFGAQVVKSPTKEIGFYPASLTDNGKIDPLFKGVPTGFNVYHWHEDMWNLPDGASLLVTGENCPHQAFQCGEYAYGLQFHVEITENSISSWANEYLKNNSDGYRLKNKMRKEYNISQAAFKSTAMKIYNNFLSIIESRSALQLKGREGK